MNKQELIKKYKRLEGVWNAPGAETARQIFLQDLDQLDESQKVVVPQFVANWIANVKRNGFKFRNSSRFYEEIVSSDDAYRVMYYILKESIAGEAIRIWVNANRDAFARAWLDGYEVEKEPKYTVKFKATNQYLCDDDGIGLHISPSFRSNFRKSDLEKLSLTEVFDSPLFEVEEV